MSAHTSLLSLAEIAAIFPNNAHFTLEQPIEHITIDSRKNQQNSLFIALQTAQNNGHAYINNALQKGALAAISHEATPTPNPHIINCADTAKALPNIAQYKRSHYHCTWVGITGSVGKTSLKNIIGTMLAPFNAYYSKANLNNTLGVPLNMAHVKAHHPYAILEAGMSKAGELDEIGAIMRPHIAILTNLSLTHIENFSHIHGIRDAKAELFHHVSQNGVIILPYEQAHEPFWQDIVRAKNASLYHFSSQHSDADFSISNYHVSGSDAIFTATIFGQDYTIKTHILGAHQALNIAIALGLCHILQIHIDTALQALDGYMADNGRGALYTIHNKVLNNPLTLYDESYNASPLAFIAVTDNVYNMHHQGRKVMIIGDMAELGAYTAQEHQKVIDYITQYHDIFIITVGSNFQQITAQTPKKNLLYAFTTLQECLDNIYTYIAAHDMILVKGSRSMHLDKIITHLQQ